MPIYNTTFCNLSMILSGSVKGKKDDADQWKYYETWKKNPAAIIKIYDPVMFL